MSKVIELWNKYNYVYLEGLIGTLSLSLVTVFFATILGTILALMKLSKVKAFDYFVRVYLGILRGTPILLQLYFFWLLLPKILPIELSDTACIVVALIINASSYVAEIIRAGIQSIDRGQIEAAKSLGLKSVNIFRKIVLPQAIKSILPALGNEYISMIKQTSLASIFFINELTTSYKTVQSASFLAIPSILIAGIIYLLITVVLTKGLSIFERRLMANG